MYARQVSRFGSRWVLLSGAVILALSSASALAQPTPDQIELHQRLVDTFFPRLPADFGLAFTEVPDPGSTGPFSSSGLPVVREDPRIAIDSISMGWIDTSAVADSIEEVFGPASPLACGGSASVPIVLCPPGDDGSGSAFANGFDFFAIGVAGALLDGEGSETEIALVFGGPGELFSDPLGAFGGGTSVILGRSIDGDWELEALRYSPELGFFDTVDPAETEFRIAVIDEAVLFVAPGMIDATGVRFSTFSTDSANPFLSDTVVEYAFPAPPAGLLSLDLRPTVVVESVAATTTVPTTTVPAETAPSATAPPTTSASAPTTAVAPSGPVEEGGGPSFGLLLVIALVVALAGSLLWWWVVATAGGGIVPVAPPEEAPACDWDAFYVTKSDARGIPAKMTELKKRNIKDCGSYVITVYTEMVPTKVPAKPSHNRQKVQNERAGAKTIREKLERKPSALLNWFKDKVTGKKTTQFSKWVTHSMFWGADGEGGGTSARAKAEFEDDQQWMGSGKRKARLKLRPDAVKMSAEYMFAERIVVRVEFRPDKQGQPGNAHRFYCSANSTLRLHTETECKGSHSGSCDNKIDLKAHGAAEVKSKQIGGLNYDVTSSKGASIQANGKPAGWDVQLSGAELSKSVEVGPLKLAELKVSRESSEGHNQDSTTRFGHGGSGMATGHLMETTLHSTVHASGDVTTDTDGSPTEEIDVDAQATAAARHHLVITAKTEGTTECPDCRPAMEIVLGSRRLSGKKLPTAPTAADGIITIAGKTFWLMYPGSYEKPPGSWSRFSKRKRPKKRSGPINWELHAAKGGGKQVG